MPALGSVLPGSSWMLSVAPNGRTLYAQASGYNDQEGSVWVLLALRRDPRTGALAEIPGEAGCVASRRMPHCHRAHITETEEMVMDPGGRALYLVSVEGITQVRTSPRTGAFIRRRRGDVACFARTGRGGCAAVRQIPDYSLSASAAMSHDGRELYVAFSGDSTVGEGTYDAGVLLVFPRTADGLLESPAPDAACASSSAAEFHLPSNCSQWDMLSIEIAQPLVTGDDVYVPTSEGGNFTLSTSDRRSTIVQFRRGVDGRLAPAPGPGACVGNAIPPDELGHPPRPSIAEPCEAARGLRQITTQPALSPDGRSLIVLSDVAYYDDVPVKPSIVDFVRDPLTGKLTQRPGSGGCLEPKTKQGCGRFGRLDDPEAVVFAGPDRVVVIAENYESGQESALVLRRDPTGALRPDNTRRGCSAVKPRRGCGLLRGLSAPVNRQEAEPVTSPDGRFLYLLEDGVAVLRIR